MSQKPKPFYGWVIVFCAFLAITTYGLFYSYSLFIEPLEAELHSSRAAISAVFTIYMVVYSVCGIPMGWLCDRYGPRKTLWLAALLIGSGIALCSSITSLWQLSLLFGVIAGMGHGAIYVVPTSTLSRWFIQRKGYAIGIATAGLGFGLFLVPPITAQVISMYGWQATFVILGVTFFAVNVIAGIFIRSSPEDKGLRPLGEIEEEPSAPKHLSVNTREFSVAEAVKTKAFWMLYLICVFAFAAEQMVIVHIVPYSGTFGISPAQASLGLSILGVAMVISRVGAGELSDRIGRVPVLAMSCGIETVSIFLLIAANSPAMLYLAMLLLGFGYGGWSVSGIAMLGDFFGLKHIGTITGIWFTCGAPAAVLGPLMGGIVFDVTKSYFLAIVIAGMVCFVAVVLALLIRPPQKPLHPESVGIE